MCVLFRKSSTSVLAALLIGSLFVLQASGGDDLPFITGQDLETATNNLKKIGLAFHEYHDEHDELPGNILAKNGTPLLSWRVAILPYINEKALYSQFKLDEPWDSKHNKELIAKMPKLYEPIRVKAMVGQTFYQVFEGEDTLYRPKKKNFTLAGITPFNGTSNTGMVFEAGEPAIWSKPADLPLDPKKPLPKLGGMFDGEFHVVFCDGHVSFFKKNPNADKMKCIINPLNTKVFDGRGLEKPPPGKS